MRCTFKYLCIKEKREIITPTSATFIFKPIHPLWLSLIKMLPPKNFAPDIFFYSRQSNSFLLLWRNRSFKTGAWAVLKAVKIVPKIDIKSPAGSSSLHGCPHHGNHSTIVTLIRSSPTSPDPRRRPCLLSPCLVLPTRSLVPQTGWV